MVTARLTSKGQTTIPKPIREFLGLRPGDRVVFVRSGDRIVVQGIKQTLLDIRGSVKPRRRPEDFSEVRQQVRRSVAKKAAPG